MAILGIGVDVLHLPRLTRHLADNRLARRILSPQELREYLVLPKDDHGRRIHFLGVRWAVKEAVYKAAIPSLTWCIIPGPWMTHFHPDLVAYTLLQATIKTMSSPQSSWNIQTSVSLDWS